MTTLTLTAQTREKPPETRQVAPPDKRLRRVAVVWALLFLNTMPFAKGTLLLPLPHAVGALITQGSLVVAFVLALSVNPKCFIRPSWFLGLYTLLGLVSVMMSIRFVGLGTTYRGFRLVAFLAVLWLLTPWWRDRGLVLLRSQLTVLTAILRFVGARRCDRTEPGFRPELQQRPPRRRYLADERAPSRPLHGRAHRLMRNPLVLRHAQTQIGSLAHQRRDDCAGCDPHAHRSGGLAGRPLGRRAQPVPRASDVFVTLLRFASS